MWILSSGEFSNKFLFYIQHLLIVEINLSMNDGERIIRIFNIQHFNWSNICLKNSKPGFNALFPPEINETSGKVACEISTTYIPISFYFRLNEESGRESRFSRGGIKSSN